MAGPHPQSLSAVICHILEVGTPILSPTYTLSPPPLPPPKPPLRPAPPQRFTPSPLSLVNAPVAIALKGRQITDGGKQRVAPGHGKLITPPPSRREGGGRGRVRHVAGGYASLTPVCTLSPFQGLTLATLTDSSGSTPIALNHPGSPLCSHL